MEDVLTQSNTAVDEPEITTRDYEVCFVLRAPEAAAIIEAAIAKAGGEVISKEEVREVRLAYPIKKHSAGFMGVVYFKMASDQAPNLEKDLRLNGEILRHLIITPPIQRQARMAQPLSRRPRVRRETKVNGEVKPSPAPAAETLTNEALEQQLKELSL